MDRLFLIQPGFSNPEHPGKTFFCWHCALIEGVLASFPELATRLHVERVPWLRPRQSMIALLGEGNQTLPLLVLSEGSVDAKTRKVGGLEVIEDPFEILKALKEKYGFPEPHP